MIRGGITMRLGLILGLTVAVSFLAQPARSEVLLSDDFSGDLALWDVSGSAAIDTSRGSPAPAVHTQGAGWIQSKQTFPYASTGITFSADMLVNRDTDVELMHPDCPNRSLAEIAVSPSYMCFSVWNSSGTIETSGYVPYTPAHEWCRGEINVRTDGIVDFYLDGQWKWANSGPISAVYNPGYFMLGGWNNWYDNASVITPEPSAFALIWVGVLALRRR
jgi:hypothetical protein